jgi:hypothetical protein
MGRRLSPKDISAARHEQEVWNSILKREDVYSPEKIVREMHVVCGCGVEGCIFIRAERNETDEERSAAIKEFNRKKGW